MEYKPEMYSKPEVYNKNAILPVVVAETALSKFFNGDQSRESLKNGKVLDVGCGAGLVTSILKSKLGRDAKLEGCDKSLEVLDHAKFKYGLADIKYFEMDACKPLPLHLKGSYDLIFSNCFMHWTHDLRAVIQNFDGLLKSGGSCIITFIVHHIGFSTYRILAKSEKWSKYMKNVERFVTPYQDIDNPEDDFEKLLREFNFTQVEVECKDVIIKGTLASLKAMLQNVDPFYPRVPEELKNSYMSDYLKVYIENGGFGDFNPESGPEEMVDFPSRILFAFATKNGKS